MQEKQTTKTDIMRAWVKVTNPDVDVPHKEVMAALADAIKTVMVYNGTQMSISQVVGFPLEVRETNSLEMPGARAIEVLIQFLENDLGRTSALMVDAGKLRFSWFGTRNESGIKINGISANVW